MSRRSHQAGGACGGCLSSKAPQLRTPTPPPPLFHQPQDTQHMQQHSADSNQPLMQQLQQQTHSQQQDLEQQEDEPQSMLPSAPAVSLVPFTPDNQQMGPMQQEQQEQKQEEEQSVQHPELPVSSVSDTRLGVATPMIVCDSSPNAPQLQSPAVAANSPRAAASIFATNGESDAAVSVAESDSKSHVPPFHFTSTAGMSPLPGFTHPLSVGNSIDQTERLEPAPMGVTIQADSSAGDLDQRTMANLNPSSYSSAADTPRQDSLVWPGWDREFACASSLVGVQRELSSLRCSGGNDSPAPALGASISLPRANTENQFEDVSLEITYSLFYSMLEHIMDQSTDNQQHTFEAWWVSSIGEIPLGGSPDRLAHARYMKAQHLYQQLLFDCRHRDSDWSSYDLRLLNNIVMTTGEPDRLIEVWLRPIPVSRPSSMRTYMKARRRSFARTASAVPGSSHSSPTVLLQQVQAQPVMHSSQPNTGATFTDAGQPRLADAAMAGKGLAGNVAAETQHSRQMGLSNAVFTSDQSTSLRLIDGSNSQPLSSGSSSAVHANLTSSQLEIHQSLPERQPILQQSTQQDEPQLPPLLQPVANQQHPPSLTAGASLPFSNLPSSSPSLSSIEPLSSSSMSSMPGRPPRRVSSIVVQPDSLPHLKQLIHAVMIAAQIHVSSLHPNLQSVLQARSSLTPSIAELIAHEELLSAVLALLPAEGVCINPIDDQQFEWGQGLKIVQAQPQQVEESMDNGSVWQQPKPRADGRNILMESTYPHSIAVPAHFVPSSIFPPVSASLSSPVVDPSSSSSSSSNPSDESIHDQGADPRPPHAQSSSVGFTRRFAAPATNDGPLTKRSRTQEVAAVQYAMQHLSLDASKLHAHSLAAVGMDLYSYMRCGGHLDVTTEFDLFPAPTTVSPTPVHLVSSRGDVLLPSDSHDRDVICGSPVPLLHVDEDHQSAASASHTPTRTSSPESMMHNEDDTTDQPHLTSSPAAAIAPGLMEDSIDQFPLTKISDLADSRSFNAVIVRSCHANPKHQLQHQQSEIFQHLPVQSAKILRVIKPLQIGDDIILLRDPETDRACLMQCTCGSIVCQYLIHCPCSDVDCPWPVQLHLNMFPFHVRA